MSTEDTKPSDAHECCGVRQHEPVQFHHNTVYLSIGADSDHEDIKVAVCKHCRVLYMRRRDE